MANQEYLNDCLDKFYKLPSLAVLELNSPIYLKQLEKLSDQYGIELSFLVILIAINELDFDDIAEYLANRYDLPIDLSEKIVQQLNEVYFQPVIERLNFFNQSVDKQSPSFEEEKNIIIDLFKNNLIIELKNYSEIIEAINQRIFAWLNQDIGAKKQIENAMLQNQEIITKSTILINGEQLPGTIANWLRCFAAEKGAANFNSLSISEFLSLSKNTANLTPEDKTILRSLLSAYRNIKFFPDSMPSDDGTDWSIIPLPEKQAQELKSVDQLSSFDDDKIIDSEMVAAPIISKKEPVIINPDNENKINQLRLMLNRYGQDSLEGQAILEEIEKLNQN